MKKDENPDIRLVNEIRQNNYLSYHRLFMRYYQPLCEYVNTLIHDRDDAKDIVQELFLNIWENRHKIDIQTNVSYYLYRTARNLTLNHIRDSRKYESILEQVEQSPYVEEEKTLELQEFRSALNDCIGRLPERNREILLLHRLKGLKQKEISESLDISVKTIKNHIWHALQRLKECLSLKEI